MKSLEESVVTAMDGVDKEIFPYPTYILQDFWEIGSSPTDMIALIERHSTDYPQCVGFGLWQRCCIRENSRETSLRMLGD